MLDSETKRRIDTARDILVGKVPDPKSQVEQITIALIYKFMDDMDAESEELGGERKFFAGEFSKYGWAKLMRSGLGGHEALALYAEAITRMPENPGIPPLFRDIFKNAYLPYRDPETLRAFLKIIDDFTYDHSERLGDAFEYLLSVLGSQGDAGQFRTPRHIIDFVVSIVDPKKNETVLDPACGTAGFLISSYKHIIAANTDADGNSTLTPDDRGRLAGNFKGYDISPDMVRLSLVNMYLHGFTDPHMFEYDTLTSQDRWNDHADVILANPPFMSPKGGIKPHNRFSVQSKRSEVLFVDYMAEHLTPNGRAGIIVPEGIIFQSQTAYRQLRKLLVEEYLVAVVSLPAGVFQPYTGVKTSILILDKTLAKMTNCIAIFRIENDGYGLGAQRRPIEDSDLPRARAEMEAYFDCVRSDAPLADLVLTRGMLVLKDMIAAAGTFSLVAGQYETGRGAATHIWPMAEFGAIFDFMGKGQRPASFADEDGHIPFVVSSSVEKRCSVADFDMEALVIGDGGSANVHYLYGPFSASNHMYVLKPKEGADVLTRYAYELLLARLDLIEAGFHGQGLKNVSKKHLSSVRLPMPPLSVQQELLAEIDGYRSVINGARAVLASYRPRILVQPRWPMVAVGDIVDFVSGLTVSIPDVESDDGVPIIAINNVAEDGRLILDGLRWITPPRKTLNFLQKGDLLFNWRNGSRHLVGKTALFDLDGEYLFASFLLGIRVDVSRVDARYLWYTLNIYRREGRYLRLMRQNVNGLFNREELKVTEISLPPLTEQRTIVAELDAEQELVAANKELIARFEQKIVTTLEPLWNEVGPVLDED